MGPGVGGGWYARRALDAELKIRLLQSDDVKPIWSTFADLGWNKPAVRKVSRGAGERTAHGARRPRQRKWHPDYTPFSEVGIPEVQDLNVWPRWRRRGIATVLMDEAESRMPSAHRSPPSAWAMDQDYGPAQRMYMRRGYVRDGRALTSHLRHLRWAETVTVDNGLVLYFTKSLRQ